MTVSSSSKVALHLYLNNPTGLLSALVPNYTVNQTKPMGTDSIHNRPMVPHPSPGNQVTNTSGADVGSHERRKIEKVKENEAQCQCLKKSFKQKFDEDMTAMMSANDQNKKYSSGNWLKHDASGSNNTHIPAEFGTATKSSASEVGYSSHSPVFYNKSPRAPGGPCNSHSVPALGFTWSLNTERPGHTSPQRKPPPNALLEKLGRLKLDDPIGVVKLKRRKVHPAFYNINKMRLKYKDSQRRSNERLHEWLDEYTVVSERQQAYLARIDQLRRGLQQRDDQHVIDTVERMRRGPPYKHRRKFPLYSLTRLEESTGSQGPSPFPSRPSGQPIENGNISEGATKAAPTMIKIGPRTHPRKLAPIVKRVKTNKYDKTLVVENVDGREEAHVHEDTPRPEMAKMKTEYEPFESIAKRNRLNLTSYLNSSLSHRRQHKRRPVNMSTVTVIDERSELEESMGRFLY
ncbi:hypothetical protein MAR_013868 [Mya arenaria]|uniref:Uncharacterized protein n=1 Tax=Mya arenaria TaxID=6604 RepID=A0ABY7G455_MYAAR|nr:hypothetical protein MAR_013868 [Mya arenaria]